MFTDSEIHFNHSLNPPFSFINLSMISLKETYSYHLCVNYIIIMRLNRIESIKLLRLETFVAKIYKRNCDCSEYY